MNADVCEVEYVDEKAVRYVARRLSSDEKIAVMAETVKTLSDPTRMRIAEALLIRELCVCDLATLLNLSQSATSHQLRILRQAGVIQRRKDGKSRYYHLDDPCVEEILKTVSTHVGHIRKSKKSSL